MPSLSLRTAVVAAVLIPCTVLPAAASATPSDDLRARLQRDADAIRKLGVPGVLAEVRTPRGRIVVRSGVADRRTGRPIPANAYYRIGSSTKTFTAVVVLQLAGEGRLSLDDTVERHLPGVVAGNGNDGAKITIRHLLRHQSGLHDYEDVAIPFLRSAESYRRNRLRSFTAEQLVRAALRNRPHFAPGTRWEYINTNYLLAGMIVERVTGRPWQEEVRDRILRPLGMRRTFVPTGPGLPRPHARGHLRWSPRGPWVDTTVTNLHRFADGGLVSTTADVNRFWRALLGGRLLRPDLLAQMHQTVPERDPSDPAARYGLGVGRYPLSCGGAFWNHGGSTVGYLTQDGATPDGRRSVAVLTNARSVTNDGFEDRQDRAINRLIDHALCGDRR